MADWYGTCRSNYFAVKDREAFNEFCSLFEVEVIEKDDLVGIISNDEYGSFPNVWDEDTDEQFSFIEGISNHLAENHVCIILEAGAEKARYITGMAFAIHSSGETIRISLSDIYAQAQEAFGVDASITEATC